MDEADFPFYDENDLPPEDDEAVRRGRVPWSFPRLWGFIQKVNEIATTPKDDWDLEKRGFKFHDPETDEVTTVRINMFSFDNQIMLALKHESANVREFKANATRFWLIQGFLREHRHRLRQEGWVKREGRQDALHSALIEALAVLPYERENPVDSGPSEWTFDTERVLGRAQRLIDEGRHPEVDPLETDCDELDADETEFDADGLDADDFGEEDSPYGDDDEDDEDEPGLDEYDRPA